MSDKDSSKDQENDHPRHTSKPGVKHDRFLADAVRPTKHRPATRVGYLDGFRFGLGFFIANLFALVVLGALTAAIAFLVHPQ